MSVIQEYSHRTPKRSLKDPDNHPGTYDDVVLFREATVQELVDYAAAHGVSPADFTLRGIATFSYSRPETEEEKVQREEHEAKRAASHEEWRRNMWEKLRAEFGDG